MEEDPFEVVGGPDADAVAAGEPEADEGAGDALDLGIELLVGESAGLGDGDDGVLVWEAVDDGFEVLVDGAAEEGF